MASKRQQQLTKNTKQFYKKYFKRVLKLFKKDNNLKAYEVNAIERKYNFWQRDSLNIELITAAVFHQKLNYMPVQSGGHYNPVKTNLCNLPEEYYFLSAMFYEKGINHFGFIEHYLG